MSIFQERKAQSLKNPRLREILESRCLPDADGCPIWQGSLSPRGYGKYNSIEVHKLWYEFHNGPVPEGLELAHSCRKRNCLIHAKPLTHQENIREGTASTKTHCLRGHLYDEANTRRGPKGERICRECSKTYWDRRLNCV